MIMEKAEKRLTIGYINEKLSEEWAVLPWIGISNESEKLNVNLVSFHGYSINDFTGFHNQENIIYDLAKSGRLDGIITWKGHLTTNMNDGEVLSFFRQFKIPVLTIEDSIEEFPCVTYGNYEGMKMIVEHFIDVHHFNKIAFIGPYNINHEGFKERYRAYLDVLKKHGIQINQDIIRPWAPWLQDEINGNKTKDLLVQWLKDLIKSEVQAIVGICDPVLIWAMKYLSKLGIHIPGSIAVAGFDGFAESRVISPPLTTINPSWMELGAIALNNIIDMINKKAVSKKTIVQSKIVIAQSCGCMEENINFIDNKESNIFSLFREDQVISEIIKIYKNESDVLIEQNMKNLIKVFIDESKGKNQGSFLRNLDNMLRDDIIDKKDILPWQNVITLILNYAISKFKGGKATRIASMLCHKARVLIGNTSTRIQAIQIFESKDRNEHERVVGLSMISTFDLGKLLDHLSEGLPVMGINNCYLSLYENPKPYKFPDPAPEWSRLIFAQNEDGRINLEPEGIRFASREIIPEDFWPNDRSVNYVVSALYFQENQIGFIVFEDNLRLANSYNVLSNQISSGLQGTFLISQINTHKESLESGIEALYKSIEKIVKNIESSSINMENQSKAVEKSASSIEEMTKNIENTTKISEQFQAFSSELKNVSNDGYESVKSSIESVNDIAGNSKKVLELLEMIQQIADQTNILAMNAAIEAAHAGEYGKGFSVVADEIRRLSDNTNNNIHDIESVVHSMINMINSSVKLSEETGINFDKISNYSNQNNQSANQLNSAMIEQELGAREILNSTHELVRITEEVKQSMIEQKKATEDFFESIKKLQVKNN
jgi:DNA-binding LacI/PurR family transcriptional regulator